MYLNISKLTHFGYIEVQFFLSKNFSLKKTLSFWAQKIQNGQNLKSMIFMEKSLRVQLTFIFNHKSIHYIIFEHLSILRKYIFLKNRVKVQIYVWKFQLQICSHIFLRALDYVDTRYYSIFCCNSHWHWFFLSQNY